MPRVGGDSWNLTVTFPSAEVLLADIDFRLAREHVARSAFYFALDVLENLSISL